MRISWSAIETYMRCPRQYYWRYERDLEPIRKPRALARGTLWHDLVETWWMESLPVALEHLEADPLTVDPVPEDDRELLAWLIRRYDQVYLAERINYVRVLGQEAEWTLPIPDTDDYLVVVVDQIEEDREGLWIREFKTASRFQRSTNVHFDPQPALYLWAARQVLGDVVGLKMDVALTYRWVKDRDPSESFRLHRIYDPMPLYYVLPWLRSWIRTIQNDSERAPALRASEPLPCTACSYWPLCSAEIQGDPIDDVLEWEYTSRERKEVESVPSSD